MQSTRLLVAAAEGPRSGLHAFACDPDGRILRASGFAALPGAGYLALSPAGNRLYAAVSVSARHPGDGEVSAFALSPDGGLVFLNSLPAGGLSCCHLAVEARHLYCANYRGGTFAEFLLAPDGRLERRTRLIRHAGRGAHPERQAGAHPHFVGFTPDGRFLAVVDLGCDGVFFYGFDPENGIAGQPAGFSACAPGAGPRHLVFDASGTQAYVANELGNSVTVCDYRRGTLRERQTLSTLPAATAVENSVAAIRLAPDGRRLHVSNRGHDSIAVFSVRSDGLLDPAGHVPAQGRGPRDFILLDEGRRLAVVHERSDTLAVFGLSTVDDAPEEPLRQTLLEAGRPIGILEIPVSG